MAQAGIRAWSGLPGMTAGSHEHVSEQARNVWMAWPQRAHGMSCDRWSELFSTVSHTMVPPL